MIHFQSAHSFFLFLFIYLFIYLFELLKKIELIRVVFALRGQYYYSFLQTGFLKKRFKETFKETSGLHQF